MNQMYYIRIIIIIIIQFKNEYKYKWLINRLYLHSKSHNFFPYMVKQYKALVGTHKFILIDELLKVWLPLKINSAYNDIAL